MVSVFMVVSFVVKHSLASRASKCADLGLKLFGGLK